MVFRQTFLRRSILLSDNSRKIANEVEALSLIRYPLVVPVHWCAGALILICTLTHAAPTQADLVYSALRNGTWGIYYQAGLTSAPKPVEETMTGDGSAPALAPDGRRVAFEVQGMGIYVCPLNSSSACQVIRPSKGSAARPAWHPVTGELLFVRYLVDGGHEDSDILTTRDALAATGVFISQTGIQDYPDVSPDGRLLAYTSGHTISLHRGGVQVFRQLWIMNLETGKARQLSTSNAQDIEADWSPSGEELAFSSDRTGQFEIWVVNLDGSGLRQVTSGPGAKTWPVWSPDGRSVMFTMTKDGRQDIWLINVDGSNLRPFEPFGRGSEIELRDADWR